MKERGLLRETGPESERESKRVSGIKAKKKQTCASLKEDFNRGYELRINTALDGMVEVVVGADGHLQMPGRVQGWGREVALQHRRLGGG